MSFTTIRDVYQAYSDSFGSEVPVWTLDELQTWLRFRHKGRWEELPQELLEAAYEASFRRTTIDLVRDAQGEVYVMQLYRNHSEARYEVLGVAGPLHAEDIELLTLDPRGWDAEQLSPEEYAEIAREFNDGDGGRYRWMKELDA